MIRQYLLACALVSCTAAAAWPAPQVESKQESPKAADAKEINVDQLKKRLDSGEKLYLLDVRRPDELEQEGMIKGAINIPIDQLESRISEIPRDKPLAIYCRVGARANRAAGVLRKNGYSQPIEYGGIEAWKGKGYPVDFPAKMKDAEKPKP